MHSTFDGELLAVLEVLLPLPLRIGALDSFLHTLRVRDRLCHQLRRFPCRKRAPI